MHVSYDLYSSLLFVDKKKTNTKKNVFQEKITNVGKKALTKRWQFKCVRHNPKDLTTQHGFYIYFSHMYKIIHMQATME